MSGQHHHHHLQIRKMTHIERLGVGLAVIGIGIALFMGLPPPWWPNMPPGLVHGGVVLGVVLIIVGALLVLNSTWSAIRQGRRRMLPIIGMAIFGLGFLGCVVWYFWPVGEEVSSIEGSIFVSCSAMSFLPDNFPGQGRVNVIWVSPQELETNKEQFTPAQINGVPGAKINWAPSTSMVVSECEIINDTKSPLLDIAVPMPVTFSKTDQKEETTALRNLFIRRLDVGADNKFTCYFANRSDQLASLRIPDEASARLLGDTTRRKVRIAQASNEVPPLGSTVILWNMPPFKQRGEGGKGGSASAEDGGEAYGGPGGRGGIGPGGDGGSASAKGKGSIAAGGEGGESRQPDGRGGRGGRSGYEIYMEKKGLTPDPMMLGYGRGGSSGSTPEYLERLKIVEQLRAEYVRTRPSMSRADLADKNSVPIEYLNGALAATNENFRVRINAGQFEFYPP